MCCHCGIVVSITKCKWNGIRASFARELRNEKDSSKSGSGKRKRAVYKYTRNMAFLRPHMHMKVNLMNDNFDTSILNEVRISYAIEISGWIVLAAPGKTRALSDLFWTTPI